MTFDGPEIRLFYDLMRDGFAVHIVQSEDGKRSYATNVEFEQRDHGLIGPPPLVTINGPSAQQLMDDLWAAGKRPTAARMSDGGAHLADMRAIAFAKLKIEAPK